MAETFRIPQFSIAPRDAEDTRTNESILADKPQTMEVSAPKQRAGGEPSMAPDLTGKALYYLEAVLSGAGESMVFVPDYLLNRAIDLGVMTGAIPKETDRDLLSRTFYSRQYEKQDKSALGTDYGSGEYVGFQEAGPRIAQAAGSAAGSALPVVGTAAAANQAITAGKAMSPLQVAIASRTAGTAAGEGTLKGTGREIATGLASQYAKSPQGMLASEAALGAGAGAVTEAADIAVPGSGQYVAMTPALLAAGIPLAAKSVLYFSPTARLVNWASQQPEVAGAIATAKYRAGDALGSLSPGREGRALNKVQKKIMEEASRPDALIEAQKAAEIQRRIKEVTDMELQLSPAEVTMSPSLGTEQARIESRMTGQTLADNIARKKDNLQTLLKFRERVFDEGEAAPSAILDTATGRIEAVQTKTGKQLSDVNNNLTTMADPESGALPMFKPGAAQQTGLSIRQQLLNMRKSAEVSADRMAAKMRINSSNPLGDAGVVQKQLREEIKLAEGDISDELLHPLVKKFLNFDFAGKGRNGKITFQDWKTFRSRVGEAKADALPVDQRQLTMLQEQLDSIVFKNANYGPSMAADRYREFAQYYKNNVILPFEDAVVQRVMRTGPGTRPKDDIYTYVMPEEQIAGSFLENSNTAKSYMKLFGSDPQRMQAIKDTILDQVGTSAVRNGRIDPNKMKTYLDKNREVLDTIRMQDSDGTYKSMYDMLSDTRNATQNLLAREKMLRAREAKISKYTLNKVLSKVDGVTANLALEQVIDMGIKDPKVMYQLARAARGANDPNIEKAFKRAVVDRVLTPSVMDSPDTFSKFLGKNESVLRTALGNQHFDDLTVLNESMRRILATGFVKGSGITRNDLVESIKGFTGVSPEGMSARMINIAEGRVSPRTTFVWLASQALRANQSAAIDRAFEASIFDKEMASGLTEATSGIAEVSVPQAKRLAEKFMYYGIQDPSVEQPIERVTIDIPGGGLPIAPPQKSAPEPQPAPPSEPTPVPQIAPGQQGSLQRPPAPASMNTAIQNMARAMPPQPPQGPAPAQQQGIAGSRYAALFPGDTLGAMAASGGIGSLRG